MRALKNYINFIGRHEICSLGRFLVTIPFPTPVSFLVTKGELEQINVLPPYETLYFANRARNLFQNETSETISDGAERYYAGLSVRFESSAACM